MWFSNRMRRRRESDEGMKMILVMTKFKLM